MDNKTQSQAPFPPVAPAPPRGVAMGAPAQAGPAILSAIPAPEPAPPKKDHTGLIKTLVIIALTIVSLTFIGLFIWMFMQYSEAKKDLDGKIASAVATAEDQLTTKLEAEFKKREESPTNKFSAPADYGHLSFNYPKIWSVYVSRDASKGGNFEALLNPGQVEPTSDKQTVNALRVSILNKSFDDVAKEYQKSIENKKPKLKVKTITVNGVSANRYTGIIPKTEFEGVIVIFKIRDKTAILQTDSKLFETKFNEIIDSVTFNL